MFLFVLVIAVVVILLGFPLRIEDLHQFTVFLSGGVEVLHAGGAAFHGFLAIG